MSRYHERYGLNANHQHRGDSDDARRIFDTPGSG